jgi:TDG/mug DNA glycosylase family protein
MRNKGFKPIIGGKPKVLILGSMPGAESLRQQQYYAHTRNLFWEIMGQLFQFSAAADYNERSALLVTHRIALWDVIAQCQRPGSLDTAIVSESIVINDFAGLFFEYPTIEYVFFNGRKAESEFMKRVQPTLVDLSIDLKYELLPSTSPANASINKTEKFQKWSRIKSVIRL